METATLKPYFVVIVLMILTSIALAITVDVKVTDEAGIKVELPDRVGEWAGAELRFCQNVACGEEFLVPDLKDRDICPKCGSELYMMSIDERRLLPPDTVILKKRYANPAGQAVFVSIVLSGKERASIHRPQVCLVGQGREIVNSEVLSVPIEGRKPLDVMVLDLLISRRVGEDRVVRQGQYYAYWFVGKGRETPYHVRRMVWMALDRIFRNVSHRWAYISVAGVRDLESEEHRKQVESFLHEIYPHMLIAGS